MNRDTAARAARVRGLWRRDPEARERPGTATARETGRTSRVEGLRAHLWCCVAEPA
jgi:hypothetical protein